MYENSRDLTFDELLAKDNSVSVHKKNLQILATETFKSKNGMLLEILDDIFSSL